jgi:ubiquinone/menaquinone biosynthesis C-methylase UbiE
MLNPSFPRILIDFDDTQYRLPAYLSKIVSAQNQATITGSELRLQSIYRFEISLKLLSLGLGKARWNNNTILEVCCGTGFLSHHLLPHINPKQIIFNDLSLNELREAKKLIETIQGTSAKLHFLQADSLNPGLPDNSCNVIIGNSFLHHFYDVGFALKEFYRLLKPGGVFISLHEPTIGAVVLESGQVSSLVKYLIEEEHYVESLRYNGDTIAPGGGTDVWMFKRDDMLRMLKEAGFQKISIKNWHLLRPMVVAKLALHLNESKQQLNALESALMRCSIISDALSRLILPAKFFGSICLAAYKPLE